MKELFFWHKAYGSHRMKQASDDPYLFDLDGQGHEGVSNQKNMNGGIKDP